jgi:hypothetical protein
MRFATTTDLMPHQVPAVAKLLPSRVGAMFMDMGTGKSRTLIELAKIRGEKWDRLFWFCPVSLKDTVLQQLFIHTDLDRSDIAVWGDKTSPERLPTAAVHIIGIESMSSSDRVVLAYMALVTERSFVVVDESSYIKGHYAKRSRRIINFSEKARYRMVLSGTPVTQGLIDLYSQMRFLSEKILGYKSFWSFANNHLEFEKKIDPRTGRKRNTGRIKRTYDADWVMARIAPYSYQVSKDECLDLPEKLYETRCFSMTDEQREAYDAAKQEFSDRAFEEWETTAIYRLFTQLQRIVCGYTRNADGDIVDLESRRPWLFTDTVKEIPESEPVIVWSKFHYCLDQITEALETQHGAGCVAHFHGKMSERRRANSLAEWRDHRNTGKRFFVATQGVGAHGLTLTESAYTVFYADTFKLAERLHAEDRNHRIGQGRRPVYTTIKCSGSIDERIGSNLDRKTLALAEFHRKLHALREAGMKEKAIELVRSL